MMKSPFRRRWRQLHLCSPFRQPPCASLQSAPCGPKRALTGTPCYTALRTACFLPPKSAYRPHDRRRFLTWIAEEQQSAASSRFDGPNVFLPKNQQDSATTAGVLRQASPLGLSDARKKMPDGPVFLVNTQIFREKTTKIFFKKKKEKPKNVTP